MESFKNRVLKKEKLFGTIVSLPSPQIAEMFSLAGLDWLFIDAEHGNFDLDDVQGVLQVVGDKTPSLVRVPLNDEIWIKRVLDAGAKGVIVPQVLTAEEALQAVSFCKYPPEGKRSVGISRAHGYGMKFSDYLENANDEILVVIQIEHIEAVRNAGTIVEVPGVDVVFVGPYDLSASMGVTGKVDSPRVKDAVGKVYDICHEVGKPAGIFGTVEDAVKPYVDMGFSLVCVSADNLLIAGALKELVSRVKNI